jgi:hypothetical protein
MSDAIVPMGRLARIGLVLDHSTDLLTLARISVMSERAGLDAIWLAPLVSRLSDDAVLERIGAAATATSSLVLGAWLDSLPGVKTEPTERRVEVTLSHAPGSSGAGVSRVWQEATSPEGARSSLSVVPVSSLEPPPRGGVTSLAVMVPCSIGRTTAEASARAAVDPLLAAAGVPLDLGLFGTLEQCQQRVLALARRGVVDVRCVVPITPDIHDVIAQLSAVSTGTIEVLLGHGRSPDPPPPTTWGGRPARSGAR